jgi:DNA-binding PadR family transcriptional regulator
MSDQGIPKLPEKERDILELLVAAKKPLYGLEIVTRSDGLITRGSVYVLLGRMKERGLVESHIEPDAKVPGMPRQLYRVTGFGKRVLSLHQRFEAMAKSVLRPTMGAADV